MSNTLGPLIGPLYESLNNVSREFVGFIPAVQRDNGNFARAAVGQQVTAFTVPQGQAYDIVPGVTPPNDGDQVFGNFQVTLTKAKYYPIKWNGEEQLGLNNSGPGVSPILMQQFMQGFRTLTNAIELDIAAIGYLAASRATGTAGTTPFGTAGDLSDFAKPAQILDDNGAPMGGRHMIVGSAGMANLRGKQSVLFKANEAGTDDLLRRGKVGMVEGFDIGFSPGVQAVTKGTGTGGTTSAAAVVGQTVIPVTGFTGTVNPGDILNFAGDPRNYVAKVGGNAPTSITINGPGLKSAIASGSAITVGNSYTPNLAFTQDALLLATRAPARPLDMNGNAGDMADDYTLITDPFSGLTFELSVYRLYRQIKFELGIVWGVAAPNPEHIATLMG